MTDRSPLIAFGLLATTVALKARTGQLRDADRLKLATSALEWVADLPEARAAVLTFLHFAQVDPVGAGCALQDAVRGLAGDDLGRDPGEVLTDLQSERAEIVKVAHSGGFAEAPGPVVAVSPDWTHRKDCGHD